MLSDGPRCVAMVTMVPRAFNRRAVLSSNYMDTQFYLVHVYIVDFCVCCFRSSFFNSIYLVVFIVYLVVFLVYLVVFIV